MTVVDPRFFSPYPVDLAIVRNSLTVADGNLSSVLDVNGNVLFIIKDKNFSLHDRHILLDASEAPILTFQKKVSSIFYLLIVYFPDAFDYCSSMILSNITLRYKIFFAIFLGCWPLFFFLI